MKKAEKLQNFFKDKRIWLTGATSGIGLSLLETLLALGAKVIATGRNKEKIAHLINDDTCFFLKCDFEEKVDTEKLNQSLFNIFDTLDIAILNAGICEYLDDVKDFDVAFFEKTFKVNYFGMLSGIQASLPLLLKSDAPYLLGMSSAVALFQGFPRAEAYGASKAAIRYTLEALQGHVGLLHPNFSISIIYPGFVKTPLTDKNDFQMPMRISSAEAAKIITHKMLKKPYQIAFPFSFIFLTKLLNFIIPTSLKIYFFKKSVNSIPKKKDT
jgi:NAD(P)-dependent dehydrogenase (short-subunit alcohol dehydrogenase family)